MPWEYYYWQCCSNIFLEDCPQGSSFFNPHPALFLLRFLLSFWQPIIFQPLSSFPPSSQLKLNKHFLKAFYCFSPTEGPPWRGCLRMLREGAAAGWVLEPGLESSVCLSVWGAAPDCSAQASGVLSGGKPAKTHVWANTSPPPPPVLHQSLGLLKDVFGEFWSCCCLQQPAWSPDWIWTNTGHKVVHPYLFHMLKIKPLQCSEERSSCLPSHMDSHCFSFLYHFHSR